eukprot:2614462-Pyramimonas_sp.AAC.1
MRPQVPGPLRGRGACEVVLTVPARVLAQVSMCLEMVSRQGGGPLLGKVVLFVVGAFALPGEVGRQVHEGG